MRNVTIVDHPSLVSRSGIDWNNVKRFIEMRSEQTIMHFCVAEDVNEGFLEFLHDKEWNVHKLKFVQNKVPYGTSIDVPAKTELLLMQHLVLGDNVTLVTASARFEPIIAAHPTSNIFMLHTGQVKTGDGHQAGFDLRLIPNSQEKKTRRCIMYSNRPYAFGRFLDMDSYDGRNITITHTADPDSPWVSILIPKGVAGDIVPSRTRVLLCKIGKDDSERPVVKKMEVAS